MPRFCVGCHSNRGIVRALALARKNLALAQYKFASYINPKQAAIPFIRVVLRLIEAVACLRLAQNPLFDKLRLCKT